MAPNPHNLALAGLLLAAVLAASACAAPPPPARLTRAQLANAAASKAQLRESLLARAEAASSSSSAAAAAAAAATTTASAPPLWPPFTPSPPLSVTDIDGGVTSLPVAGAPLVAFAYNGSDSWTAAAWANSGELKRFLADSAFGAPDANATRYLFASFNQSAGGAAAEAAFMRAALEAGMASLAWPAANRSAWLARATFAAEPVSALGEGGWVAQLLGNWTNLGESFNAALTLEAGGARVTVPRLDGAFAWLPPAPQGALRVVYGGAAGSSVAARGAADGAAVLVTCGFAFGDALVAGAAGCAAGAGGFAAIVRDVAAAGGAFAVIVLPAGAAPSLMDGADDAAGAEPPSIAATQVTFEHGLALWRAMGAPAPFASPAAAAAMLPPRLSISAEEGKSGCTFSVSATGTLLEAGWLGQSTLRFLSFAAMWLDFERRTQANVTAAAAATTVVSVMSYAPMQGYPGAQSVVTIPAAPDGSAWTSLKVELALGCPTPWETSCAIWDRQQQLLVCCSNTTDSTCGGANLELLRGITPFRRGLGRWVTDVSPLLPLLVGDQTAAPSGATKCLFTAATDAWAMPWTVTVNLHLGTAPPAPPALRPRLVSPLWSTGAGGNGGLNWGVSFDQKYNDGVNFPPRSVSIPSWATRATLHSVITGHGSDNNNCAEFCVTEHEIAVAGAVHRVEYDNAGTDEGCAYQTLNGALPNEHGTWLYGRDAWCDGSAVRPWIEDVTQDIDFSAAAVNVTYRGLFNNKDPNPDPQTNMPYMIVHSYLVWA